MKALYIHHIDILGLTGSDGYGRSSVSVYHLHGSPGHGGTYHSTSGIPYLDALHEAAPAFQKAPGLSGHLRFPSDPAIYSRKPLRSFQPYTAAGSDNGTAHLFPLWPDRLGHAGSCSAPPPFDLCKFF